MKELKFECSSCGQKIGCDPLHAGRSIPCPICGVEIQIPRPAPKGTGRLQKATRVVRKKSGESRPEQVADPKSTLPKTVTPSNERKRKSTVPVPVRTTAVPQKPRTACPCCGAELELELAGATLPPTAVVSLKSVNPKTRTPGREQPGAGKKPGRSPRPVGIRTGRPQEGKRPNMAYILSGGAAIKPGK